jgi:hypothetical protein
VATPRRIPIRLEALRDALRIDAVAGSDPSLAHVDISDVTSSSRAVALVARSFAGANERSLGPDVFSRVELAARARGCFGRLGP